MPKILLFILRPLFRAGPFALLLLLGVALALLLLETGLFLAGLLARSPAAPDLRPGQYRILCLGESTTAFGGRKSWPAQLEAYLSARRPEVSFRVINKAHPAITSSYLLDRVGGYLDSLRPDLVVAMIGINDDNPFFDVRPRTSLVQHLGDTHCGQLLHLLRRNLDPLLVGLRLDRLARRNVTARPAESPAPLPPRVVELLRQNELYRNQGRPALALASCRRARDLFPDHPEVLCAFGDACIRNTFFPEAEQAFLKASRLSPSSPAPALKHLTALLQMRAYRRAEAEAWAALKKFPDNPDLLSLLARALQEQNRNEAALVCLLRALRLQPEDCGKLNELGWFYLETGALFPALECFEAVIRLDPGRDDGYIGRGLVLRERGLAAQAAEMFSRAAALNPLKPGTHETLAELLFETGRRDEGLRALKQGVKAAPLNPLARIAYWKGRLSCGLPVPDRLVRAPMRVDPECFQGYLEAGLYYLYDLRLRAEAAAMLRRALELLSEAPADPRAALAAESLELLSRPGLPEKKPAPQIPSLLARNYARLHALLSARGVPLVCVQYPLRPLAALLRLFPGAPPDVVFVGNEENFSAALAARPYADLFTDRFAGDSGHATPEGNRLIAEAVGAAVLERFFPEGSRR